MTCPYNALSALKGLRSALKCPYHALKSTLKRLQSASQCQQGDETGVEQLVSSDILNIVYLDGVPSKLRAGEGAARGTDGHRGGCLTSGRVASVCRAGSSVYYQAIKRLVESESVFPGMEILATTFLLQVRWAMGAGVALPVQ